MIHHYIKRPRTLAPSSWAVPDICKAYNWASGTGEGLIAIVELGGGYLQSDVDTFCSKYNVPIPTITNIVVSGPGNDFGKSDADGEVALDIQVAAGSCSGATKKPAAIRMYWAEDMSAAIRQAADDGCSVCSISWGDDEAQWREEDIDNLMSAMKYACQKGMLVFAASGDNDSSDGGPTPANVDLPASNPYVIACGGTKKEKISFAEVVWNDDPGKSNGEGTGGGFSTKYVKQVWQKNAPTPPPHLGRLVPDITANADPETGYEIILNGEVQIVGGTSAVAPLFAGYFATFGTQIGWCTDKLWANPQCFNDITLGNNGIYHALRGPDACSGMGSPKGVELAKLLTK